MSADLAPDVQTILALALGARAGLPAPFAAHAEGIELVVQDFADPDVLEDLGIEDAFELTGLYDGTPLTAKSLSAPDLQPDRIYLYRRAILDEWIDRGNVGLGELVFHVLIHELAHHFGWSDAEISRIAPWQD